MCTHTPQNELLRSASVLKEANAINLELKKHVSFQFVVLTDTSYSPIPFAVATGTDVDVDLGEEKLSSVLDESEVGLERKKGPMVCVEVRDSKHGATNVWSLSKFR